MATRLMEQAERPTEKKFGTQPKIVQSICILLLLKIIVCVRNRIIFTQFHSNEIAFPGGKNVTLASREFQWKCFIAMDLQSTV